MRYARTILLAVSALAIVMAPWRSATSAGSQDRQPTAREHTPPQGPVTAEVSVCFVPQQECDTAVADSVAGARKFVRVQAYGFTSPTILRALADARRRGVDVQVILDKTDDRADGPERASAGMHASGAAFTAGADIPTWIDDRVAIAHNKIIVVDGHLVIGGSYNYTVAAERKNAENVTFIDLPALAELYLRNWEARKAVSRPSSFQPANDNDARDRIASSKVPDMPGDLSPRQ